MIGERNQVTVPKVIRKVVGIKDKSLAFIGTRDGEPSCMYLSVERPESGVFNTISISEKGQMVIPTNLRLSLGVTAGTNLVFTAWGKGKPVEITRLDKKKSAGGERWQLLFSLLTTASKHGLAVKPREKSLLIIGETSTSNLREFVGELEKLVGTRLLVEKTSNGMELSAMG